MTTPLFNEIADLLAELPNLHNEDDRRAFMLSAGLDEKLIKQIDATGPSAKFFPFFVELLGQYGTFANGELALIAVLTAAQDFVGQEKKAQCRQLIERSYLPPIHTDAHGCTHETLRAQARCRGGPTDNERSVSLIISGVHLW